MKKTLTGVLIVVLAIGLVLPMTIAAADEPDVETNSDIKPTAYPNSVDVNSESVLQGTILGIEDFDIASYVWACPYCSQTFSMERELNVHLLLYDSESEPPESEPPELLESEPAESEPREPLESEPTEPKQTTPLEVSAPSQVNQGANLYVNGNIYLPMPDTFGGSFMGYCLVFELEGQGGKGGIVSGSLYWTPPYAGEVRFRIKIGTEDIPPGAYRLMSHLGYTVRFPEEDTGYWVWENLDTGLTITINEGLSDNGNGNGFINHLISVLRGD